MLRFRPLVRRGAISIREYVSSIHYFDAFDNITGLLFIPKYHAYFEHVIESFQNFLAYSEWCPYFIMQNDAVAKYGHTLSSIATGKASINIISCSSIWNFAWQSTLKRYIKITIYICSEHNKKQSPLKRSSTIIKCRRCLRLECQFTNTINKLRAVKWYRLIWNEASLWEALLISASIWPHPSPFKYILVLRAIIFHLD